MANPKLKVDGINKIFIISKTKEEVVALQDINFEVMEGEFVSIVGPSGCGKSTLLHLVAGLQTPTKGHIFLDGKKIEKPGPDRGVLFQDYALYPWLTVYGNVGFGLRHGTVPSKEGLKDRDSLIQKHIKMVGLDGSQDKYPHQLSGGMKQRCALARLLVNGSDMLLMDEPLAAVDAQTRDILQEELLRIWGQDKPNHKRKTVLYITHNIDEAVLMSDRVIVLSSRPGRIREIIDIDLPRPRSLKSKSSNRFHELSETVWGLIKDDAYSATVN